MIRSHFAGDASEQGDIQKGSFQRMEQVIFKKAVFKGWCEESSLSL